MITPPDDLAFTVLLPVWAGDDAGHFMEAFASLERGGARAAEVLVCQDGPLGPDLEAAVAACCERPGVRRLVHPVRRGLYANLNDAMDEVQTPWAARADADDLNLEGRFSDQIAFLARHPEVDVLGGAIIEFWPWGAERMKSLPLDHEAICAFARFRSPINHMTAFIRARAFRDAGGYPPIDWAEDYGLWLRMLATGARFANLAAPLVRARLGDDFLARRTGSKALAAEAALWGLKRRTPGMGVFSTGAIFWARCAALAFPLPARAAYWALRR